jgi:hypothetical protein
MATLIRVVATVSCVLIVLGFAAFVSDEAGGASKTQVGKLGNELDDPGPSAHGEALREREHSRVRETIDDANDILLSPFAHVVHSRDAWVRRVVPTLLALLAYGGGLMLLANYLPQQRRRKHVDWRTA